MADLDIRTDLEAHAAKCRKALAEMRPRPALPADLTGAYLAGTNLAGANLAGTYLAGANLADANLADADLADADLAGANLAGADIDGANLTGANLAGANLKGADLAGANLDGANLTGANLAGANLAGADIDGANGIVDTVTIAPIGSRRACLTATKGEDGTVRAMTGCFTGTLDELAAAVEREHGANEHGDAYRAAIALIRVRFGVKDGGRV